MRQLDVAVAPVTLHLDEQTLAMVDRVADAHGRSRSHFLAEAVRRVAESEADFLDFVQVGVDDLEAGRTVSHEEVMAELDAMIARHQER